MLQERAGGHAKDNVWCSRPQIASFPKEWPADREQRARYIGEWLKTKARYLVCKRVQVDEIWAFVYAKQKNVALAKKAPPQAGDVWTWTAIDAEASRVPHL